jgi:hypothetical protein
LTQGITDRDFVVTNKKVWLMRLWKDDGFVLIDQHGTEFKSGNGLRERLYGFIWEEADIEKCEDEEMKEDLLWLRDTVV